MTTDSSRWHSGDSIDPSCGSVDALCGLPQSRTGAAGQHCPWVDLATTAVVDPRSTNPINGLAHSSPGVLQNDRETTPEFPTDQQVWALAHPTPDLQLDDWARAFESTHS